MNEIMTYEDIRFEIELVLGDDADSCLVDEICKEWVRYLNETKAENSAPLTIVSAENVDLPAGHEGASFVLRDDEGYGQQARKKRGSAYPNAAGRLDKPRLFLGRMYQVSDLLSALFCAFLKAAMKESAKKLSDQPSAPEDPVANGAKLFSDIAIELVADFRNYVKSKKVGDPEERAIVVMAFSQYETERHDTKNEPFTAKAMVAWLEWAKTGECAQSMPPRVRYSVRDVRNGNWHPTAKEVDGYLSELVGKGFLKSAGKSGSEQLYCINV